MWYAMPMRALANPYMPQSFPFTLAGRDHELSTALQLVSGTLATGHAAPGGVVLYGVRGVGKTSALREVSRIANAEYGFVSAWVAAAKGQPFLPSLAATIKTALENYAVVPKGKWSLDSLGLTVKAGPVNASATAKKQQQSPPVVWNVSEVEALLRNAADLCQNRDGSTLGTGLLLFVDEMHAVNNDELAILLNALQNISHDEMFSPRFVFLGAGLPSIRGVITKAATFGERSRFMAIGDLDTQATRRALVEPAAAAGVSYHPDALEMLADATNGYPYFVQLFGYHAWEIAQPNSGDVIGADAVQQALERADIDVTNLFVSRLSSATSSERDFIVALAQLVGDGTARRSDIARMLGRTTSSISDVRSKLIDKAIITEQERGRVRFTVPGFAQFVLDDIA